MVFFSISKKHCWAMNSIPLLSFSKKSFCRHQFLVSFRWICHCETIVVGDCAFWCRLRIPALIHHGQPYGKVWYEQFSFDTVEMANLSHYVNLWQSQVFAPNNFSRNVQIATAQLLSALYAYPSTDPILGLHIQDEVPLVLYKLIL